MRENNECVIVAPPRPNREIGKTDAAFVLITECKSARIDLTGSFGGYTAAYIDELVKQLGDTMVEVIFITTNNAYQSFAHSSAKRRNMDNVKVSAHV